MPHTTDTLRLTRFYGFFHFVARQAYEMWFRGEVLGTENIPLSGPFFVASNHASHLDPPLVGCQVPRQMRFFARKTLWNNRLLGWWMDQVETIPVDREGSGVGAIKRVLQAIHENRGMILFPEGTRTPNGHLQTPKAGVGMMACKTGVPVVPCRISGSFEAFGKGTKFPQLGHSITIVFGPAIAAIDYDNLAVGKKRYQVASARIFERIAALPQPHYPII